MGLIINPLEPFGGQVRIDLCCDQVRVAQQFLHTAQVCARIQQLCGVTVAQLMRRQYRVQAGSGEVLFQS